MSKHDIELRDEGVESSDERTAVIYLNELRRSFIPAAPDRHVLVRMDSANVGQVFALDGQEWTLGRHASSKIVLGDDGVSRRHARVFFEDGAYVIEDLGSANGTFVGGKRIQRHRLTDGDVFQLGPTVLFRYAYTDASQERMLMKLYEASVRDALTGAYNREHFEERLKAEIAYARRHSTQVSLVMIDLDHFKLINDTHGHPAGDAALVHTAEIITKALRTEDVFARYGGEEFAVILRGIDVAGAERVGERLRGIADATPATFENLTLPVTMSVGCASLTECPEPSTTTLVAVADRRLYAAKRSGRNRVVATG